MATRGPVLPGLRKVVADKKLRGSLVWRKVANAIKEAWVEELMQLSGVPARWKRAYVRCLHVKVADGKATVIFDTSRVGKMDQLFASAIERGIPVGGIDMKPWFLKGGKPYVDIPLGHTEDKRSGYKPTAGHTKGSIERLLTGMQPGERSPEGMVERLRYTARGQERKTVTDPLAHALRQTERFVADSGHAYGQEGSIYTIRRISKNSDPQSWHWARKGRKAYKLASKIQKRVGAIIRAVLGVK